MPPRDDDEEDVGMDEDDDEPSGPPRPRPRPRRPKSRRGHEIREWSPEAPEKASTGPPIEPEEEDVGPPTGWFHRVPRPVFYRAREAVWFEPLVALMIVILMLVGLWAYTGNWPPAYVVESSSMQHGATDQVGLINTGDLVLAQKVPLGQIVTYFEGMSTDYRTYGEFGDVLLYHPNNDTSVAPIIHRAILYIEWNSNGTYSIPTLSGLACGNESGAVYRVSAHPSGCGSLGISGTLSLHPIGWMGLTVNLSLTPSTLGSHSGFLTMGDNNFVPGAPPRGDPDQPGLSSLVEPGWIVGVARGMIPWFGALKLVLDGNAQEVPQESWEWLGLTVAALFLGAAGLHYALKAEGIEDERRKADEEAAEDEEESPGPRRRWRPLTAWIRSDDDDEDDGEGEEEAPPPRHGRPKPAARASRAFSGRTHGGRPRPVVRKHAPAHSKKRRSRRSDDDL